MGVEWRLRIKTALRKGVAFKALSEAARALIDKRASCKRFGGGRQ